MKKSSNTIKVIDTKTFVPTPHPQQHRLDDFRAVPSLVTAPLDKPKGK